MSDLTLEQQAEAHTRVAAAIRQGCHARQVVVDAAGVMVLVDNELGAARWRAHEQRLGVRLRVYLIGEVREGVVA